MMRRFSPVVLLGLCVLLAACTSTRSGPPDLVKRTNAAEDVILRTGGDPGERFIMKLNVDGVEREWSAVSPAELPLRVCVIEGVVTRQGSGKLVFEVVRANSLVSFGCERRPCHFQYHDGGIAVWW